MQEQKSTAPKGAAFLILQKFSQLDLRAFHGTADSAFVDTPFPGNLIELLSFKVIGHDGVALQIRQFRLDQGLEPLYLLPPGNLIGKHFFKPCIFHCASIPDHSNGQ